LPWQGLKAATNKQKYEKIGEKNQTTPIKDLCEGFPEEFGIYLNYVRKLGFEENPDYDFLRELFTKVLKNIGETEDGIFDWMLRTTGKGGRRAQLLPITCKYLETGSLEGTEHRQRPKQVRALFSLRPQPWHVTVLSSGRNKLPLQAIRLFSP